MHADKKPTVSVIMNCLNSSQDLEECLTSLMCQTFQDFEVIFYDNCSTDESPAIVRRFQARYGEKIRYFRGESVVPLGSARNRAIACAEGEFIAFLDCDDLWREEKLARQVACMRKDERTGLVTTDTILFDGKRELSRVFQRATPRRGYVFRELMQEQWITMSSAMVRREALAGLTDDPEAWSGGWFDERLNVCEEADVFYRIAHDWKLDYVETPETIWRVHGSSTTFQKYGQFAKETFLILEKHKQIYPGYADEYADLVELLTRRATFQQAVDLWRNGDGRAAREVLSPYRHTSRKHRIFWYCSYLPGACFTLLSRLYFALPFRLH